MAVEHVDIVDAERHEPKGAATAAIDTVYVSDGAASGAWNKSPGSTYGGIESADSSIAIATIGTTAKVFAGFDTDMPANNVTIAHASDNITVITAGDYAVHFQTSFATASGADDGTYEFHLRIDAVEHAFGCHREMTGTTDTGSVGFSGVVTLAAAEVLTVYIESDNGGDADDIVVEDSQFWIQLLKAS